MKRALFNFSAIMTMALILAGYSEAQEPGSFQRKFHTPRHIDSICPPDYRTAREKLEQYFKGSKIPGGPDIDKLVEVFGARPLAMSDVRVLNDIEDARACAHFNQEFSQLIDLQYRLFEGVEPEYVYDFSYYKTGDFYIVALGGGFLIQEDPRNPGNERASGGPSYYQIFVYDRELKIIQDSRLDEMLEGRGTMK